MSRAGNRQDVASKIAWEGGIYEALEYGIKAKNMPEGDLELAEAWQGLDAAFAMCNAAVDKVLKLLPSPEALTPEEAKARDAEEVRDEWAPDGGHVDDDTGYYDPHAS